MTCSSCQYAQSRPNADMFSAGCLECIARATAVTGGHLESEAANKRTEGYTHALKTLFGDKAEEGHAAVKRWAAEIKKFNLGAKK
jgi:hypothetical protein